MEIHISEEESKKCIEDRWASFILKTGKIESRIYAEFEAENDGSYNPHYAEVMVKKNSPKGEDVKKVWTDPEITNRDVGKTTDCDEEGYRCCPECGWHLYSEMNFCPYCGQRIKREKERRQKECLIG